MLFYENLEEIVFHRHEMFDVDELIVLSGYVGPQPVGRLQSLPFKTSVIFGMYGADKISEKLHHALLAISATSENTTILYSKLPVHSKCYVWRKNKNIVAALVGSANFSVSGLSNPYKEVLAETTFDTFAPLNAYLQTVLNNCVICSDDSIKLKNALQRIQPSANNAQILGVSEDICRTASLLDENGQVPQKSGLNWGLSDGHTAKGDAYIKISKLDLRSSPQLFPPKQLEEARVTEGGKKGRQNDAVEFMWDDGTVMEGLLEATQFIDDVAFPKHICSSPRKNILGTYLRQRLGVDINHLITVEDLHRYGRTTIDISLQGEGIYYLDFSV